MRSAPVRQDPTRGKRVPVAVSRNGRRTVQLPSGQLPSGGRPWPRRRSDWRGSGLVSAWPARRVAGARTGGDHGAGYAAARSGSACGGSGQALEGAGLCHPALDVEVRVCGGLAKPGCAGHLSWSATLSRPACTHGSSTPGEPEAPAPPMTSVPSLIGSPPGMAMMLGSVTCWRTTGLLSAKRLA